MQRLRTAVEVGRRGMARLADGAEGREVCGEFAATYDDLVSELWRAALAELAGGDGDLALVATGGWGRREVSPFSDIDFIVLAPPNAAGRARALADKLLYPMWDAGIDVGHAVRDPHAAAELARDDLPTATALLDMRLVVGATAPVAELARATRRAIAPGDNPNGFISRLVAEQQGRHERFGDSLYLLEPNLKHGIGALRDLATALWAARARWRVVDVAALVEMGHLSARQGVVLVEAHNFMLKLRSLTQLAAGRRTDQLTFEIQESIAPRLYPEARLPAGDIRPAVAPAVEALMRRYYLHARGVSQVEERLLELALVPVRRRPRIVRIDGTFLVFNGRLAIHDPAIFSERPAEMLRMFRVALAQDLVIYGHTKELVADNVAGHAAALASDGEAAQHFLAALVDARDARQPSLLEEMHQLGLLNAVIPEFAPCTCRVQHDLYHVYTVDQHQLYAVAMLKRLARHELDQAHPTASAALASINSRLPLYLATLLHDVGKPMGTPHSEIGAGLAATIARRLGLADDEVERCEFLVREHLTMSHISQRRDLSDPEVIARLAGLVGDRECLAQLYVLTLCDTAMTAPDNLTAWKEELLRETYTLTRSYLGGEAGEVSDVIDVGQKMRKRVIEILSAAPTEVGVDEVEKFVNSIDTRFFTSLTARQIARHVRLAWKQERNASAVELKVAHYPLKGHSELAVVAADVHGLLAALAGVLAANRVDVLDAMVGCRAAADAGADLTPATTVALDLFYVRDLRGQAIPVDDARWARISSDLETLLAGGQVDGAAVEALMSRRRPPSLLEDRVTPGVPTKIRIDNQASAECTVVEVSTRDGVGVLYAITNTLAEMGFDIHIAKVVTEGEKVADVFYVTDGVERAKITGDGELARLRSRLERALAEVRG